MAKTYEVTPEVRFINNLMQLLLRLGLAPKHTYLLTVKGRKSGREYSTPVTLVEEGGQRWLVAPYGEVNWVHNARAAGRVTLRRGRRSETVSITELGPAESAPVLKKYVKAVSVVQPYFEARPDAPLEEFAREASRHPVFLLGKG